MCQDDKFEIGTKSGTGYNPKPIPNPKPRLRFDTYQNQIQSRDPDLVTNKTKSETRLFRTAVPRRFRYSREPLLQLPSNREHCSHTYLYVKAIKHHQVVTFDKSFVFLLKVSSRQDDCTGKIIQKVWSEPDING